MTCGIIMPQKIWQNEDLFFYATAAKLCHFGIIMPHLAILDLNPNIRNNDYFFRFSPQGLYRTKLFLRKQR